MGRAVPGFGELAQRALFIFIYRGSGVGAGALCRPGAGQLKCGVEVRMQTKSRVSPAVWVSVKSRRTVAGRGVQGSCGFPLSGKTQHLPHLSDGSPGCRS